MIITRQGTHIILHVVLLYPCIYTVRRKATIFREISVPIQQNLEFICPEDHRFRSKHAPVQRNNVPNSMDTLLLLLLLLYINAEVTGLKDEPI
jgi:hypothetical protein